MARSEKRAAPAAAAHTHKKPRTARADPAPIQAPTEDSEDEGETGDFEDLEASGASAFEDDDEEISEDEFAAALGGLDELEEDDDEEDSDEADEAELDGSEDDQMIGDDAEDLYANLDAPMNDEEDSGDEDDEDSQPGGAADDDGWETVATAPTKPLIAPAAELEQRRKAKKPKALSAAELRALAFAELTASPISNVLAMHVASVLDPATPPAPASSPLQPVLKALHAHLTSLPKQKPVSLDALRKKGRVVPDVAGSRGKWGKMELPWEKPRAEDVRVVGRWAWGGGFKQKGEYLVELAIAMPPTLLQPKDYLFPRFSVKALHYLVSLAAHLPDSLGPVSLSYASLPGSQGYALEIRSVTPKGAEKTGLGKAKGAVLRVRVVAPAGAFPASKLAPLSNVVRPPSLAAAADGENPQVDPSTLPATPLHSTALHLSSLPLLTTHLKYHHGLSTSHAAYASSARLLQAWAAKRGYGASLGLTDEWWAWCVARSLNAGGRAGAGDSASLAAGGEAWAGWRKAVEWLAGANWTEGIWFKSAVEEGYAKDELKRAFEDKPLFVDPTGTVNLAAGIDLSTLDMLKHDARDTISLLLSGVDDERKFDSAFVREIRAVERFDNYARITLPFSPKVDPDASLDYPDSLSYLTASICATLRRALGKRVRAFILSAPAGPSLPVDTTAPKPPSSITLSLGFLLDPVESLRLVDQGPSAEDEEACADFRAFWGNKSELRRFQDGAIVEAVVWNEASAGALGPRRSTIVRRVVEHILNERHGVPVGNIDFFAGAMDHLIVESESLRRSLYLEDSVATGKGFSNAVTAFDDLAKEIKELKEIPLQVSAIQPCTPGLRYSSVFTPSARRLKDFDRLPASLKYLEPLEFHIALEGSGSWPDDLEAVQKIKSAFLAKMGEGLEARRSVLKAEVVVDVEARPIDDNVSLEILTATGWAFRARIFYDRSQVLLEEREEQLGEVAAASSSTHLSPLDTYLQRFVHAPKHHAAMCALQNHFPSFSPTVRLLKRWVSAHMLSSHFAEQHLELVAASVFLDAASPFDPPQSGATGFARVMDRLATWKWRDEPLLVPVYSFTQAVSAARRAVLPVADRQEAIESFQAMRLAKPNIDEHAWVIATEADAEGTAWGRCTGKVVAARVRGLAKATLATLQAGVLEGGLVVEQLFSPPLGDYAFLIQLDASLIPRHFQSLTPDPAAVSSRRQSSVLSGSLIGQADDDGDDEIRVAFDPVADFVKQLQRLFPSIFLLFHSEHGSPVLGGIWHPSVEAPRALKVGLGYPTRPVVGEAEKDGKAKVVLDKKAVFRDIERLGKRFVVKVEEVKR
ncbi:U3 snoRNP protein [Rhodotorula kratochvilovae]